MPKFIASLKLDGIPRLMSVVADTEVEAREEITRQLCKPGRYDIYDQWRANGCIVLPEQIKPIPEDDIQVGYFILNYHTRQVFKVLSIDQLYLNPFDENKFCALGTIQNQENLEDLHDIDFERMLTADRLEIYPNLGHVEARLEELNRG